MKKPKAFGVLDQRSSVYQWFKKFFRTMQIQSDQKELKPDKRKKTISMKPINHNYSRSPKGVIP